VSTFFETGILEVGLRPKKRSPKIVAAPLAKFLNTPLTLAYGNFSPFLLPLEKYSTLCIAP
jgi:hypothetical protein